jgi:1-phosphofructokinase
LTITVEAGADSTVDEIHLHAGGQGLWVARMMRALGVDVTLCCALGGESGRVLRTLIEGEDIEVDAVSAGSENGAYVHDRRSGERAQLAETYPDRLSRHTLDDLYGAALTSGLLADVTVLTGAEDYVLPAESYRRLAADLRNNDRLVLADLSGEQLVAAAEGGVDVVKASEEDLRRDELVLGDGDDVLLATMAEIAGFGARALVVTRAERPLLAFLDGEFVEATTPTIEAVDHRGAGDSLTGAMAATMAAGGDLRSALQIGAAAGATNVTRRGLATGTRAHIERMAELVEIHGVSRWGVT